MVVILEHGISTETKESLRSFLTDKGFQVREIVGENETIFGAVGSAYVDLREVEVLPGVTRVIPISKPYKLASRELKPQDTIVKVGSVKIGGNRIVTIAGPCSVENRDALFRTAETVVESGAVILRGGAFKPRTSPYSFQGLAEEGLQLLREAGQHFGIPVVSEIVSPLHIDMMKKYVDMVQIGARNMQNFELLKAVGAARIPVMLKRGLSATIEEWLMAAEYLLANGSEDVVLCERGIRTFETYTRNSLDISSIPVVKKLSHLPVIVDPSHATGIREKVPPVALAAIAAGADGIMVEVHHEPNKALSDGPQSLYPQQFEKLMRDVEALSPVVGREIARSIRITARKDDSGTTVVRSGEDESTVRVGFQGARGAYSEVALHRYFDEVTPVSHDSFRDVFDAVIGGAVQFGIVPLENSLMGSIHQNYDLLLQYPDVHIVGETRIRIEHSLIGMPGTSLSDISEVFSQAPGIEQCRDFLDKYPNWKISPFFDTAGSVAWVAERGDPKLAAIAHARTADLYGLQVLKEGIETNPRNYTRFVVIAPTDYPTPEDATTATVVFSTPDKPGALFECMRTLAEHSINMHKLESRPIPGKPWQYMFYVDLELPRNNDDFRKALVELNHVSRDLRELGRFR